MCTTGEDESVLEIPNEDLDAWLSALKPYQSSQIKALLAAGRSEMEIVDAWLSARGANATVAFGGAAGSKPFRERFMDEFKKFVCGDKKYNKERAQLIGKVEVAKTAVVSAVSAAVATQVGAAAALLIPPVAVLLHIVGKVGIQAWCCDNEDRDAQKVPNGPLEPIGPASQPSPD